MSKLKKQVVEYYIFYCPGCKHEHSYMIKTEGMGWSFNGDMDKPTFRPSLLNRQQIMNNQTQQLEDISRCHLFITDGKIDYCSDCSHEFSGKTVEMNNLS
jgi:hypothetical protein